MTSVTIPKLQTTEELDRALAGVLFKFDWQTSSITVDIGGIIISFERQSGTGDLFDVTLTIENSTALFYDAGVLWLLEENVHYRHFFFRPNPKEKYEVTTTIVAGTWQLSLWEQ